MAQTRATLSAMSMLVLRVALVVAPSGAETLALGLPTVTEPTVCVAAIWSLYITLWDSWIEKEAPTRSQSVVCCTVVN